TTSFLPNHFAISPDGSRLAFVAVDANRRESLWVRDLGSAGAQQLTGTDGARAPFWHPRGNGIGFFAEGKLRTIDLARGEVRVLCDARIANGGAWHADEVILFAGQVTGPVSRVAEQRPSAVSEPSGRHRRQGRTGSWGEGPRAAVESRGRLKNERKEAA